MTLVRENVLVGVGAIALIALLAALAHSAILRLLARIPGQEADGAGRIIISRCRRPSQLVVSAGAAVVALSLLDPDEELTGLIRHALALVLIGGVAWLLVQAAGAGAEVMAARFNLQAPDNLRARRVHTQAMIFRRVTSVVIGLVAVAVMLTTFPQVRTLGASLLASAGIAGIVVGFAAQQTLANLLAGIQIAITEPIRLDDVVVLEDEWGRIEEITFTYVVVSVWDERRLILPISYFTTTPFENWTRTRSEIVGSVHLHVDYSVPVDELRAALDRILGETPLWDGRVSVLQVVEADARTVELRALVSARDAPSAWDLRCLVRERMIEHLRRHHPESLPRLRAEIGGLEAVRDLDLRSEPVGTAG